MSDGTTDTQKTDRESKRRPKVPKLSDLYGVRAFTRALCKEIYPKIQEFVADAVSLLTLALGLKPATLESVLGVCVPLCLFRSLPISLSVTVTCVWVFVYVCVCVWGDL